MSPPQSQLKDRLTSAYLTSRSCPRHRLSTQNPAGISSFSISTLLPFASLHLPKGFFFPPSKLKHVCGCLIDPLPASDFIYRSNASKCPERSQYNGMVVCIVLHHIICKKSVQIYRQNPNSLLDLQCEVLVLLDRKTPSQRGKVFLK